MYKYFILIGIMSIILCIFKRWDILIIFLIIISSIYLILIYVLDQNQTHNKMINDKYCRKSDINNPMGNVLLYTNGDELEYDMCANPDIESNLRFNIYNDKKDLYMRRNNIRPFITMPTIQYPNDIQNVKNQLYNFNNASCKLDSTNCTFNENIKYHKNYFIKSK